jgi:hypothetical protein
MADDEVVIVDHTGHEHVFPAGFDPRKAGQIVRNKGLEIANATPLKAPSDRWSGIRKSVGETVGAYGRGVASGVASAVDPRNIVSALRQGGEMLSNPAMAAVHMGESGNALLDEARSVAQGDPAAGGRATGQLLTALVAHRFGPAVARMAPSVARALPTVARGALRTVASAGEGIVPDAVGVVHPALGHGLKAVSRVARAAEKLLPESSGGGRMAEGYDRYLPNKSGAVVEPPSPAGPSFADRVRAEAARMRAEPRPVAQSTGPSVDPYARGAQPQYRVFEEATMPEMGPQEGRLIEPPEAQTGRVANFRAGPHADLTSQLESAPPMSASEVRAARAVERYGRTYRPEGASGAPEGVPATRLTETGAEVDLTSRLADGPSVAQARAAEQYGNVYTPEGAPGGTGALGPPVPLSQAVNLFANAAKTAKLPLSAEEFTLGARLVKQGWSQADALEHIAGLKALRGSVTKAEMRADMGARARGGQKSLMAEYGDEPPPTRAGKAKGLSQKELNEEALARRRREYSERQTRDTAAESGNPFR